MIITIQNKQFDTARITQLYPAAVVKTGFEEETTQVSLEWLDTESQGRVEVVGFGIFLYLDDEEKHTFMFNSKEEMDEEIGQIASQLK